MSQVAILPIENPINEDIKNDTPNLNEWIKERRLLWRRVREDGISIKNIADDIGVSRSLLSQFLNNTGYRISDDTLIKLGEYFKKINYWDEVALFNRSKGGFISKVEELDLVITDCWKRVWFVLDSTKENKNFGMITGPSGCGKTAAVKYWLEENSEDTVFITANNSMTKKAVLRRIAKELGMFAPADADALIERICAELKANPKLIIIDEADQICSEFKLETLRSLIDAAEGAVGIVLIGNEDLSEHILKMAIDKRKLSRIHNRFGANQKVKMPSTPEVEKFLAQVNLTTGARYRLTTIMQRNNGMGGYRVCISILRTLFAALGTEQITEENLRGQGLLNAVLSLNA